MAEPMHKNPAVDQFIKEFFGIDREDAIRRDVCVWCKGPAKEFRGEDNRTEYSISGLCQRCQDVEFGKKEGR